MSKNYPEPSWLADVEDKDFTAAYNYLSLKLDEGRADQIVRELRAAPLTHRRANDTLRACGYKALPLDDPGVKKEAVKLRAGRKLSPILVVRFEFGGDIADGFHRLSYTYGIDPYAEIPMRLANWDVAV